MDSQLEILKRTLVYAEIALGQMKALRLPADPPSYELWYTYATGQNPAINQAVNDTVRDRGELADADLARLHQLLYSTTHFADRLERIGGRVGDEIAQVMGTVEAALASSSRYGDNLRAGMQALAGASNLDGLRAVVDGLAARTRDMAAANRALQQQLDGSRGTVSELKNELDSARSEGSIDSLTLLANRKHFDHALHKAIGEAHSTRRALALVMCDIDHFKTFNDRCGHLFGDQVLRAVAKTLKETVRNQDIAARYGGEEFGIILPTTPISLAKMVAERIRLAVTATNLRGKSADGAVGPVTLSFGVALFRPGESPEDLIERADACLYAAKSAGRNRVVCEHEREETVEFDPPRAAIA